MARQSRRRDVSLNLMEKSCPFSGEADIFGAVVTLADSRTAGRGLRGLRPVGIPRGVSGEGVCQILCLNSRAFGRSKIRESRV